VRAASPVFLAAIILAAPLAGCAPQGPRLGGLAPSGVVPGGIVAGGVPAVPERTLSAGDQFAIRLPFAADYDDTVTVGMDGTVAPKAIGSVPVGGLTVPEATARLTARYAKLLKDPQLSITVRRYAPAVIYVDGWVRRPGLIRSNIPLTLARALAQAGGVKTGAKTGDVLIMRHDTTGRVRTYSVALGSFAGAGAQDPLLKSFDVVYVPQNAITAVSEFAKEYYANVPFSARFNVSPTPAPTLVTPQVVAPSAAAP
jgi:protein involved in polysaccharide export with SLBB domain